MWDSSAFVGALTPKFYVALTGTSSLISGLILIFEWWYYRKYGSSFIEQVSLAQLGPWLGGGGETNNTSSSSETNSGPTEGCRVWRNGLALLRGAEHSRLRVPLTYYDMNLSAQEHQAWFTLAGGAPEDEPWEACMARAWRERGAADRVQAARHALRLRDDCAPALLLLAEEDARTVREAEVVLRRAWRCAAAAVRRAAAAAAGAGAGTPADATAAERLRRDVCVLAHVKRRLAWCARRLGRPRDAARLLRDMCRDERSPQPNHDLLLEVLLEQRAYPDAAALLARLDPGAAVSATALYTTALLRCRTALAAGAKPADSAAARAALRRALEYNPHVAEYLLEERALAPPPEHVTRRGASEALAYAFWHAAHWRAADGALRLLADARPPACRAAQQPPCAHAADQELLASPEGAAGAGAGGGAPDAMRLLPLVAGLCSLAGAAALAAHRWPDGLAAAAHPLVQMLAAL